MKSKKTNGEHDPSCDYCSGGRVHREIRDREVIRVTKSEYVILEGVPIGVCNNCKARYYHASVLKQAEALHQKGAHRTVKVPVARFVEAG
jgi:YgiT-type zinc finger domain-containing protein